MRVLVDLLHPAHVHVFRHVRERLLEAGHEVLVTVRDKDVTVDLLRRFGIDHHVLSSQGRGSAQLAAELGVRTAKLVAIARRFRPDVMVGIMGPSIAIAGRLLKVPSVVFYDTELASITNRWVYPLATAVCTPDCYSDEIRGRHIRYPSYHEFAYLHPDQFTANPDVLVAAGLAEPFAVVRYVSWDASHDRGKTGLPEVEKIRLVETMAERLQVVVSSEGRLPSALERFRLRSDPSDIHHVLAQASVVVGESGTMNSEAAVLGTPAILFGPHEAGVFDDQERYGLLHRVRSYDVDEALAVVDTVLAAPEATSTAHARLLADKISLTPWIVDYIVGRRWLH